MDSWKKMKNTFKMAVKRYLILDTKERNNDNGS